jgi:hypothetical protein
MYLITYEQFQGNYPFAGPDTCAPEHFLTDGRKPQSKAYHTVSKAETVLQKGMGGQCCM